jgi:hypothetical protein
MGSLTDSSCHSGQLTSIPERYDSHMNRMPISAKESEDARIGYSAGIAMIAQESATIWSKYNAMLVANSVVLAVMGLVLTSARPAPLLEVILPMAGLVLCAFWLLLTRRGFDYFKYWVLSTRELEEAFLAPTVHTLSRGADFAAGQTVPINLQRGQIDLRMKRLPGAISAAQQSYAVIWVFNIIYIAFLFGR